MMNVVIDVVSQKVGSDNIQVMDRSVCVIKEGLIRAVLNCDGTSRILESLGRAFRGEY